MLSCRGARFMGASLLSTGGKHAAVRRLIKELFVCEQVPAQACRGRGWQWTVPPASVLGPVAGSADGFLPALVECFASVVVAGGFEDTLDAGLAAQFFQAAPEAGRQTRQVGGAQCGGFLHARAFDPGAEQVGLELHEEVVG